MALSSASIGRLYTSYNERRKTMRVARKVDMVDVIVGIKMSDWRKSIRCKMTGQKVEGKKPDRQKRQKI